MNAVPEPQPAPSPALREKPPAPPALTLGRVATLLRMHWKLFAAIALLVTAVVLGVTLWLKPLWTAAATIQIEPTRSAQTETTQTTQGQSPDQAIIDTQIALMTSHEVLADVVLRLGLQNDSRFARPSLREADRVNAASAALAGKVRAERQGTTYLVSLSGRSDSPAEAAQLANAVADSYLAASLRGRADTALEQSEALSHQLDKLGQEVNATEARVASFRGSRGIVQNKSAGTITDQQVEPLAAALATAEAEAATAQAKLSAARTQIASGDIESVANVLGSPVITDLRRQRVEAVRRKGENDATYGPTNPSTIALQQQIAGIDQQIRAEANRLVEGLAATANAASAAAGRQRAQLAVLRAEQANNARAGVTAESMERDAEAKRTVYNQLAETAQQAAQRRQGAIAVGTIVDRARAPAAPSFPNKPLFGGLGVVLGLLAGSVAVVGVELLNRGLKTPEELEAATGAAFIVSVPYLSKRKRRLGGSAGVPWDYLLARPMSAYAESLRAIRSALQLSPDGPIPKVIAIVSSLPNEGKTSLAGSLARIMALSGDRTLLINADLRRNTLGTLLPIAPQAGLLEVLAGNVTLKDALILDELTGLQILPLSEAVFSSRDVFAGSSMAKLLDLCRQSFDHIVIDTPPLLAVADSRKLAALADANLLAVRWNVTSRFAVQAAAGRLRSDNSKLWGTVFTLTDLDSAAVGLTDPAHYAREYKVYQD